VTHKDHPLWRFTLQAHRQPGVHEACVTLQIEHHIDVNFLFWCCWVAEVGGPPLDEKQIGSAFKAVGEWQGEVVRPVWEARRKLKPGYGTFPKDLTEPLRQELIAAELNAEHIEMLCLAESVKFAKNADISMWQKASNAVDNLKRYLARHLATGNKPIIGNENRGPIPENVKNPLSLILHACFPDLKKQDLLRLLDEKLVN
jgi:uncharacterized protein (TIGR02444 family)